MTIGETDARVAALNKAMLEANDKTAAFLQALADDAVKVAGDKVLIVKGDKAFDAVTDLRTPPRPSNAANRHAVTATYPARLFFAYFLLAKQKKVSGRRVTPGQRPRRHRLRAAGA